MPSHTREFTPADRLQRRIAAHKKWAKTDAVEGTRAAREKFLANFLAKVDAHAAEVGDALTEDERIRRAESLKKAHFTELARKSAKSRAAKKRGGQS